MSAKVNYINYVTLDPGAVGGYLVVFLGMNCVVITVAEAKAGATIFKARIIGLIASQSERVTTYNI